MRHKIKEKLYPIGHIMMQAMTKSLLHSEHQVVTIGIFGTIGFPLYYYIWTVLFPQPYETLSLRMIGCLLCFGLSIKNHWPKPIQKYMPIYWYITIMYCLGFFFSFMLFKSQVTIISAMSSLVTVFLMILLVDWMSLIIMSSLGLSFAWLAYMFSTAEPHFPTQIFQYLIVYIFTIVGGTIFNYKTALLHQQKLEGMASISSNVAHELRTPLLGLKSGVVGLKKYLPILIETYQKALQIDIDVPKIRPLHFNNLLPALERMESEIIFANTIIDMLLMNVGKQKIDPSTFEKFSIVTIIISALERYPFDSAEQEVKIHWEPEKTDFIFNGSQILMEHILFNLLKNALHFIVKNEKGEIFIWLESDTKRNYLFFKDTGIGIKPDILPHIFDRFYTTTLTGTGIGLAFCKMVMQSFNGDIMCRSEEGKFTEFVMLFPKVLECQN